MTTPADLKGKRVAIRAFQTTLSLLAKGDLKFEYGVPWEDIHWLLEDEEKIAFTPKPGVKIETLPKGTDVGHLLRDGKADAVIQPHPPDSIMLGQVPVRRLFADADAEELRYFKKYGYWPIMHIMAIRNDAVARDPGLPRAVMEMYGEARALAKEYFSDPNFLSLAFGRRYFEREQEKFGADIWPSGLASQPQEPRAVHHVFARPGPDQRRLRGGRPVREIGARYLALFPVTPVTSSRPTYP